MASRPGWVAVGLRMDDLGFWPVGIDVATSFCGRDMGGNKGGRDMEKMASRRSRNGAELS